MFKRKSNLFLFYIALNAAAFVLLLAHAHLKRETVMPALRDKAVLAERLELTDLCIFTDARYTRNPSMADLHTPGRRSRPKGPAQNP